MGRFKLLLQITALLGGGVVLAGCTQPGETHMDALEQAQSEVRQGLSDMAPWKVDSVEAALERIAVRFKDLDWLTTDTTLTFSVDDADIVGDWARARRFLKDGPGRLRQLERDAALCLAQTQGLLDAIEGGAQVDAQGTPMDEAYYSREVARELKVVAGWLAAWEETERLIRLGTELEQAARPKVDSLIVVQRAAWARQISAQP